MEWMIQYKIKGDTEIKQEIVELDFYRKPKVIKWWKENRNSKKDKDLVNCSNNGDLNIKHIPLIGVDLALQTLKDSSQLQDDSIVFSIKGEEIIRVDKDTFSYKGEKIKDVHNVYQAMNEYLQTIKNI